MADVTVPIAANVTIATEAEEAPTAKSSKKPSAAVKKGPTYTAMVTKVIQELKEKKGSSIGTLLKNNTKWQLSERKRAKNIIYNSIETYNLGRLGQITNFYY